MHSLKNISFRTTFILISFSFFSFLFTLSCAHAANAPFSPLVGIPGLTTGSTPTLPQYINALYLVLIGFGSLVAVIRIAWAGVKYSLDGVVTHKEEAKKQIWGVLLGLAILLIPYIVLNTINPELTSLNVLKLAPTVRVNLPADDSRKLTANEIDNLTNCENKPGKVWDPVAGWCVDPPAVSPGEDATNTASAKAFCEGQSTGTWNATTKTCDPKPFAGTPVTEKCVYDRTKEGDKRRCEDVCSLLGGSISDGSEPPAPGTLLVVVTFTLCTYSI